MVEGPELMELLGLDEDGIALADDVDGVAEEDLPRPCSTRMACSCRWRSSAEAPPAGIRK